MAAALYATCAVAQAAVVRAIDGRVDIVRGEHRIEAKLGSRLREGDEIVSSDDGEALIRFDDGGRVAVRPGSRVQLRTLDLTGPVQRRQKTVKVIQGSLRYVTGKAAVRRNVHFETAKVTIGIRGTDLDIAVTGDAQPDRPAGTWVRVRAGAVLVTGSDGTQLEVEAGQAAFSGEPELTPRGAGQVRRAATRRVELIPPAVFRDGAVDRLMR